MNRTTSALAFLFLLFTCGDRGSMTVRWPNGVKYEIFVRAFADGNGDGTGDLKGLSAKLDYLQNLGVNGLWLMPVMKSPSYHKYDVIDYKSIDPEYGTLEDFKFLVKEAHQRNIRIIIDLVLNHTSPKHPWFVSASSDRHSPYRNYYVWAKKDSIRKQISKKSVTLDSDNIRQWHPVHGDTISEQYYGFFSSHMPDLNFDNPKVMAEFVDIGRFWLQEMGVDGFRFDAARHIFPNDRPADNHAFWISFRKEMEKINPQVYMVGEVWAGSEVAAPYLKGIPSLFNFDLGYDIVATVNAERDTLDLIGRYNKIASAYRREAKDYLDATFLRNHDQNRILSDLGDRLDRSYVAAGILLTLPGTPYLYYGEEIGMKGFKPDEFIREPFLWDSAKNDQSQTRWEEPRYSNDHTVVPLRKQMNDPHSLYHFYQKLIQYRNESKALSEGSLESLPFSIKEVVGMVRTSGQERLLILHNISDVEITLKNEGILNDFSKIDFDFRGTVRRTENALTLPAYSMVILK